MAVNCAFRFVLTWIFLSVAASQLTRNPYMNFITVKSCSGLSAQRTQQFFNPVLFICDNCKENSTVQQSSNDGLSCICQPGYRYKVNFGGSQVECELCGSNQAVSEDGWECVYCQTANNTVTKKCEQCTGTDEITVLRFLNGSVFNNASPGTIICQKCSGDTQPDAGKTRCEICSTTQSIRNSQNNSPSNTCACGSDEQLHRGICFKTANIREEMDNNILPDSGIKVPSQYLVNNLLADYLLCKVYKDAKSCQSLANMCVLTMYKGIDIATNTPQTACGLLVSLSDQEYWSIKPDIQVRVSADDAIYSGEISTQWTVEPAISFPFMVATYSLDGVYEGSQDIDGTFLQLCDAQENVLNAAFVFGTYYSYSCTISAKTLLDQVKYPLKFYEIYLKYQKGGDSFLYKIPIKITNFRNKDSKLVNQEADMKEWQLVRRFFLVDNQAMIDADTGYIRYASSLKLLVTLQNSDGSGQIYVPYFEVTYSEVTLVNENSRVPSSFSVSYIMDQASYIRNFQIATGTLSSLAIVYAGYRTYVWNKRAGRITIDFPTLINFFFYLCNYLGGCFFIVVFGIAFYFFIFFKRQNIVYLVHPDGVAYEEWLALLAAGFTLKALSLVHLIVMQCSADIFMVDWERPKGQQVISAGDQEVKKKKSGNDVSIWRTYFVANEWNELQTKRKINCVFQIFAVVFFLHVVHFEDMTTKDPDGTIGKSSDIYQADQSKMFRMALATVVYVVMDAVQVFFFVLIYERFITDDIREFVDLCSMSNVSVFVMAHAEFGYYIHGRSVHGRADVGMREMSEMLEREVNDLVGKRGLVPQTEPQTFVMALPKRLRQRYETVYMPVQLEGATPAGRAAHGKQGGKEKTIEAYSTLNRFLCAFIDHSLRDVDYVVKKKSFIEKVLDTEFMELTDKGIFYSDNGHSFDNVLFYGNELTLVVFEALLFCIVDLIFENFVLAGIVTYIFIELICLVREMGGKKNLAKKTLVDERFLI